MDLDKNSYQSDGIVNLYRAALYLARGSKDMGLHFLLKAKKTLGKNLQKLLPLFKIPSAKLKNRQQQLFWAEKVLDQ